MKTKNYESLLVMKREIYFVLSVIVKESGKIALPTLTITSLFIALSVE